MVLSAFVVARFVRVGGALLGSCVLCCQERIPVEVLQLEENGNLVVPMSSIPAIASKRPICTELLHMTDPPLSSSLSHRPLFRILCPIIRRRSRLTASSGR
jgi:hypothetical protein